MEITPTATSSIAGPPAAKKVKLESDPSGSGKLLLTAVQPTMVTTSLIATPLVSSGITTSTPTVLNFTFSNGELRPCTGPSMGVGAQMTVTSNLRGDGSAGPSLQKPIIVTLSGIPTVQGKSSHLGIPTSTVIGQSMPIQAADKLQLSSSLTTTSAATILSALSSALPNSTTATPIPIVVATAPPGLTKGSLATPGILSVTPISTAQLQSASVTSSASTSNLPGIPVTTPLVITQAPILQTPLLSSFLNKAHATATEKPQPTRSLEKNNNSANSKTDPNSPDFDPIQAMDWKDGVATLPGSNIKLRVFYINQDCLEEAEELLRRNMPVFSQFKLNEFGTLEVITDFSDSSSENVISGQMKTVKKEPNSLSPVLKDDVCTGSIKRNIIKSEHVASCENCGCLGRLEDFVGKKKRFCSDTCVSVNSTRKIVNDKQKENLMKKKRRKLLKAQAASNNLPHGSIGTPMFTPLPSSSLLAALSVVPIAPKPVPITATTTSVVTVAPFVTVQTVSQSSSSHPVTVTRVESPTDSFPESTTSLTPSPSSPVSEDVSFAKPKLLDEPIAAYSPVNSKNKKPKGFSWSLYLELDKAEAAAGKLFRENQTFPSGKNYLKTGMKLEGIDPRHPSLFCVLSVVEVVGFRVRLHFDGYSDCYDFWVNADSIDIFPVGFCEKTGRVLQPPKGYMLHEFDWNKYLQTSRSVAAPKHLFSYRNSLSITPHGFRVGMKLEAVDKKNSSLVCVATVTDVLDNRFLIHFDGWEDMYDYWVEPSSPYIHPINWCLEHGHGLTPPNNYKDPEKFCWTRYLSETKSQAAPSRSFKQRIPNSFKELTKLECVDRRNPMLIRVTTLTEVQSHTLKVHFDGWSDAYDYWVDDDSPDIHPINWCLKTGHPLQPPINPTEVGTENGGCPTPGCKGVGHIKGPKYTSHHSAFGCPYSYANMNKEMTLQDRTGTARQESVVLALLPTASDVSGAVGSAPGIPSSIVEPLVGRKIESNVSESLRRCPTPGCNGSGHVTGKYTVHHRVSGCPLAATKREAADRAANGITLPQQPVKSNRGRKKTKFPLQLKGGKESSYNEGSVASSPSSVASSQLSDESRPVTMVKESLQNSVHRSVFSGLPGSAPPPSPAQEMPFRWDQHSQLLPGVMQISGTKVCNWTIENVSAFITSLTGCAEQGKIFRDEQIDGEAFLLLNQADIVKILSVKLGPALKIFNSILLFRKTVDC